MSPSKVSLDQMSIVFLSGCYTMALTPSVIKFSDLLNVVTKFVLHVSYLK